MKLIYIYYLCTWVCTPFCKAVLTHSCRKLEFITYQYSNGLIALIMFCILVCPYNNSILINNSLFRGHPLAQRKEEGWIISRWGIHKSHFHTWQTTHGCRAIIDQRFWVYSTVYPCQAFQSLAEAGERYSVIPASSETVNLSASHNR
jgi:hypothetical protein